MKQTVPFLLAVFVWGGTLSTSFAARKKQVKKTTTSHSSTSSAKVASTKGSLQNQRPSSLPVWKHGKGSLSWRRLFLRMQRYNPLLVRMKKQVAVLKTREKQTLAWPDLKVGIRAANIPIPSFSPTATTMTGVDYSISQRIPVTQRLNLKQKVAALATKMGEAAIVEQKVWLWFQLRSLVSRWSMLRDSFLLEKQVYGWLQQVSQLARTRYMVQKASQQEYLRALTSQVQVKNKLVVLKAKAQMLEARMARLLGLPRSKAVSRLPPWTVPSKMPAFPTLWKTAKKHRGVLLRWRVLASQSQQMLKLARTLYWTGVTISLNYRQMVGGMEHNHGMLSLGLSLPIPSGGNIRRKGLAREAMARHQLAGSRLKESLSQIRERLRVERIRWKQLKRQIRLSQRQLLPLARQSYNIALRHYPVGKSGYADVIRTLQTYVKEKLRLLQLHHLHRQTWFRLQALSGTDMSVKNSSRRRKK